MNSANSVSSSRASSGPRVDERRHGGERVVDEVRGDLRAQRRQLGARQPLALRLHLRQLDHRRHQRGRLADDPRLLEPQPARPVVERHQRADAPVADHERRDDRRAQRAAGVLAVQLRLHSHPVVARLARQLGEGVAGPVVVAAERRRTRAAARRRRARPRSAPVSIRRCGAAGGALPGPSPRRRCGSSDVVACTALCIAEPDGSITRGARNRRRPAASEAASARPSSTPSATSTLAAENSRHPAGRVPFVALRTPFVAQIDL